MSRRIWIVGGSSGIGFELVKMWLEEGERVIVGARQAKSSEALQRLKDIFGDQLQLVDIDASDAESVKTGVENAWNAFGGIDVWMYNAAAYDVLEADSWHFEAFEVMARTNYLGPVCIMTELFPRFKAQGHGRWVWNASLSAAFGLPYGGGYSAPKAALVNLAEALQPELQQYGIELQIINHGFVRTRLTAKNDFEMPQLMTPEYAALQIFNALKQPYRFEIRFPFKLALFLRLLRVLPYSVSLMLTRKMARKP